MLSAEETPDTRKPILYSCSVMQVHIDDTVAYVHVYIIHTSRR